MSNFLVIAVCLLAGLLLGRFRRMGESAPATLNSFVIHLSFPAVVLIQIPQLLEKSNLNFEIIIPVSMAWLQMGLSILIFSWLGQRLKWHRTTIGAVILTAGLGNTSFVGFPLLESIMGIDSLRYAVLGDQLGSFLVVSTLGLIVARVFSGTKLNQSQMFWRIITFPPFLALVISVAYYILLGHWPEIIAKTLEKISLTLVPLALVSVGLQLRIRWEIVNRYWKFLTLGLAFKLVFAPLLLFAFYRVLILFLDFLNLSGGQFESAFISRVTILESAMAPMITAAIVAAQFELDTEIANLMVGIGIPVPLLTVPLWNWLLLAL